MTARRKGKQASCRHSENCALPLLPKASTELPPPISKIASPPNGRLQQLLAGSEVSMTSKEFKGIQQYMQIRSLAIAAEQLLWKANCSVTPN